MLSASLDKYLGSQQPMYQILYEHISTVGWFLKNVSDYLTGWNSFRMDARAYVTERPPALTYDL
jgi:hypothetical protein